MVFEFELCSLSRCVTGGRGGGREKRMKRLPYIFMNSNVSRGREEAVIVQNAYHLTSDLRWHGQQLLYSLQQPIRIHGVLYFRRRYFNA